MTIRLYDDWRSSIPLQRRNIDEARMMYAQTHNDECRASENKFSYCDSGSRDCTSTEWDHFSFMNVANDEVDNLAPEPFSRFDLARVSKRPLFTREECAAVIAEAESCCVAWRQADPIASFSQGGGSLFLPILELDRSRRWLNFILQSRLYPSIASQFACDELSTPYLRVTTSSIVKYNASSGHTSLGVHRDGPLVTATIALNSIDDYDGGGTFIEALASNPSLGHNNGVLRVDTGNVILHPGTVRHGGNRITRGLRYILVVWIFSTKYKAPEHYAMRQASNLLANALRMTPSTTLDPTSLRFELLVAAADSFDEAIKMGAGAKTESAHLGLGQAALDLGLLGVADFYLREALVRAPKNSLGESLLMRSQALKNKRVKNSNPNASF